MLVPPNALLDWRLKPDQRYMLCGITGLDCADPVAPFDMRTIDHDILASHKCLAGPTVNDPPNTLGVALDRWVPEDLLLDVVPADVDGV